MPNVAALISDTHHRVIHTTPSPVTVLKESRLTSSEKGRPLFHSNPMNLARENTV